MPLLRQARHPLELEYRLQGNHGVVGAPPRAPWKRQTVQPFDFFDPEKQKPAGRKIFQPNHREVHFLGKSDWESQIRISID
jgi:hypothetical protein